MIKYKNVRQGHTRWKVVVYSPSQIEGYDQYVAIVYRCFVTAVLGSTVHYQCGDADYICGRGWFINNTVSTFRKAVAQAQIEVDRATQQYGGLYQQ